MGSKRTFVFDLRKTENCLKERQGLPRLHQIVFSHEAAYLSLCSSNGEVEWKIALTEGQYYLYLLTLI